jgi:uncharacterized membrane protein YagU involved in acid resistance
MSVHDVTQGALAGAIATAPMTVAMVAMHRALPPKEQYPLPPSLITEELEEKAGVEAHVDREAHRKLTFANHFGYGALCGAVFASFVKRPTPMRGVGFGLFVWSTSYYVVLPALRLLRPPTQAPPRRNALMIAAHVVWGAALALTLTGLRSRHRR